MGAFLRVGKKRRKSARISVKAAYSGGSKAVFALQHKQTLFAGVKKEVLAAWMEESLLNKCTVSVSRTD